jgi:hypothetical protein
MILKYDLSHEFINYGDLQAFQINYEHLNKIKNYCKDKTIIIKLKGVKLEYKFNYIDDERYFTEACLLDRFNRILAVAYQNDYVIKDNTETYVLNKEKFEKLYPVSNRARN